MVKNPSKLGARKCKWLKCTMWEQVAQMYQMYYVGVGAQPLTSEIHRRASASTRSIVASGMPVTSIDAVRHRTPRGGTEIPLGTPADQSLKPGF